MAALPQTLILSPLFCFSKKRLFEEVAQCASTTLKTPVKVLIDSLNRRESQGSTVFFEGAALPHALIEHAPQGLGVLSILDQSITFNSIDSDEVRIDIAYTLFIAAHEDYDQVQDSLRRITAVLSNQDLLNSLRLARNERTKIAKILGEVEALLAENQDLSSAMENEEDTPFGVEN
ncbi:MAG: PTS sugar transporter subunit IIA [Succinivibrio sp.]|nr:PTS sugar transporter subunit IIA [Succinivibrio sp.]